VLLGATLLVESRNTTIVGTLVVELLSTAIWPQHKRPEAKAGQLASQNRDRDHGQRQSLAPTTLKLSGLGCRYTLGDQFDQRAGETIG